MSESGKSDDRQVVLGTIVGAFGVAGWVNVQSYTDPPENLLKYAEWRLRAEQRESRLKLVTGRVTAKGVSAQLEGVTNRDQAAQLRGALISVARDSLPVPGRGEYYWDDLLGLDAYAPSGDRLGSIVDIRATPAHALLAIAGEREGRAIEHLVPLVKSRLLAVDLSARRVTIDWHSDWT
jgi:16S rRNA processing protein RimM